MGSSVITSARFASVAIAAVIFIAAPVFAQSYGFWTYEGLARTPAAYVGWTLSFRGKVVQVMDEHGIDGPFTALRIAISPDERSDIIYVEYRPSLSEPRILVGDMVEVRANFLGIKSYKTVLGATIEVPHVTACEVKNAPNSSIQVLRVPQQPVPCNPNPA
jgi:hypothetical protein